MLFQPCVTPEQQCKYMQILQQRSSTTASKVLLLQIFEFRKLCNRFRMLFELQNIDLSCKLIKIHMTLIPQSVLNAEQKQNIKLQNYVRMTLSFICLTEKNYTRIVNYNPILKYSRNEVGVYNTVSVSTVDLEPPSSS